MDTETLDRMPPADLVRSLGRRARRRIAGQWPPTEGKGPLGTGYWLSRCVPLVDESARFLANELAGRSTLAPYTLCSTGQRIYYRHPYADAWVLEEIFGRHVYEPPQEVREALGDAGTILDLGGHIGLASLFFASLFPGAEVIAVEPSRPNADLLRRTLSSNGVAHRAIEAAAGVAEGEVSFDDRLHLGRISEDGGRTVPRVDVMPLFDRADLVKLDIQGGEWEILGDRRLAASRVRAMVIEYHPHGAPTSDPRADVIRLLDAAGFTSGEPFDEHRREGTIWAWR